MLRLDAYFQCWIFAFLIRGFLMGCSNSCMLTITASACSVIRVCFVCIVCNILLFFSAMFSLPYFEQWTFCLLSHKSFCWSLLFTSPLLFLLGFLHRDKTSQPGCEYKAHDSKWFSRRPWQQCLWLTVLDVIQLFRPITPTFYLCVSQKIVLLTKMIYKLLFTF